MDSLFADSVLLSIIIPTLNEEKCLPQLLDSIKKQSFKDYEIIVADAGSHDRTREIAQQYGCRIVDGGLPPQGRNEGAKIARGELLLFVDSDIILPADFLKKTLPEFRVRNLGVSSFLFVPRTKSVVFKTIFAVYNFILRIFPFAGMVILATREVHQKLDGFDERISLAEDSDYIFRAKKMKMYGLLKPVKAFVSLRRFESEGRWKTSLRYILSGLYILIFGAPRSDIFKYRFDIYRKKQK